MPKLNFQVQASLPFIAPALIDWQFVFGLPEAASMPVRALATFGKLSLNERRSSTVRLKLWKWEKNWTITFPVAVFIWAEV